MYVFIFSVVIPVSVLFLGLNRGFNRMLEISDATTINNIGHLSPMDEDYATAADMI